MFQLAPPPFPHPSSTTNLLSVSIDIPLLDISQKWNLIICGLFDWFLSLCILFTRFIHVAYIDACFLFMVRYFIGYTIFLSIHHLMGISVISTFPYNRALEYIKQNEYKEREKCTFQQQQLKTLNLTFNNVQNQTEDKQVNRRLNTINQLELTDICEYFT